MLIRPLELDDPAEDDTALTMIGEAFFKPDTPASEPVEVELTRRLVAGPDFIQALALAAAIPESGAMIGVVLGTRATIGGDCPVPSEIHVRGKRVALARSVDNVADRERQECHG